MIQCLHHHLVGLSTQVRFTTLYSGKVLDLIINQCTHMSCIHPQLLVDEVHHVLSFLHYTFQQMYRFNDLLTVLPRRVHGTLYRFLRFDRKIL